MKMVRDKFSESSRVNSKLDHIVLNVDNQSVEKLSVYAAEDADDLAANPRRKPMSLGLEEYK